MFSKRHPTDDYEMLGRYIPNQYHIFGEFLPGWIIKALILTGVLGSIITVQLLLPSELPMELQRHWVESKSDEHLLRPPSPIDSTSEVPTIAPNENLTTEEVVADLKAFESDTHALPQIQEEISEPSTHFSRESDDIDIPPDNLSTTTQATEQEVPDTNSLPIAETRKDTHQTLTTSPNSVTDSTLPQAPLESAIDLDIDCPPLFSVTFERNSIQPIESNLNQKAKKLQEWLSRYPESILLIDGHTDSSGPEELNLLISSQRADVIYELLAESGIAKDQMGIRAFGEFAPLRGIPTDSSNNRRVFLRVEGIDTCR